MLATSSNEIGDTRRGSLRDLALAREATARATQELQARLQTYRNDLIQFLRSHYVNELGKCIDNELIEIEGTIHPVDAFEKLLQYQIESAPVYCVTKKNQRIIEQSSQNQQEHGKELKQNGQEQEQEQGQEQGQEQEQEHEHEHVNEYENEQEQEQQNITMDDKFTTTPTISTRMLSRTSRSSIGNNEKTTIPIINNNDTVPNTISLHNNTSNRESIDDISSSTTGGSLTAQHSMVNTTLPHTPNQQQQRYPHNRFRNSILTTAVTTPPTMPSTQSIDTISNVDDNTNISEQNYKYTGFLDIRDLVSSMIFIAVQPINEDELVYTSNGAEVPITDTPIGLEELAVTTPTGTSQINNTNDINPIDIKILEQSTDLYDLNMLQNTNTINRMQVGHLDSQSEDVDDEESISIATDTNTNAMNISTTNDTSTGNNEIKPQEKYDDEWSTMVRHGMMKFNTNTLTTTTTSQITVSYLSRRNPFKPVKSSSTLYEAAEILAKGGRRIPLIGVDGRVIDIQNQNRIIKFMYEHIQEISDNTLKIRACDLNIGTTNVKTIDETFTALEAFVKMDEESLSGLAIIDEEGRFLNATSSRDLKRFAQDKGKTLLSLPILEYLEKTRNILDIRKFTKVKSEQDFDDNTTTTTTTVQDNDTVSSSSIINTNTTDISQDNDETNLYSESDIQIYEKRDYTGQLSGSVTIDHSATVQEILCALYKANVNRAFCLDEDDYPSRVIAISDIMKFACGIIL